MLELTGVHSGYGQIPILRDITLHAKRDADPLLPLVI